MLKAGVLGAGHLGKIHLKLLELSDKYELVGFYDPSLENSKNVSDEFGYYRFNSVEELIDAVDVVDIVTPTLSHFDCAKKTIEKGCHIFIEKPITNTVIEAEAIKTLASQRHIKGQVGHVERFNPAFTAVNDMIVSPMFIECHRLAEFNPRGTDVPVVLDLMIHDIDIVLKVIDSNIKNVSANGVAVISDSPDITNARVEFENGAVANFTASRISLKNMRKTRLFQNNAYISVDFLDKKSEVVKITNFQEEKNNYAMVIENIKGEKKQIYYSNPELKPVNSIIEEHNNFAKSIINKSSPLVSFKDGFNALELAIKIINKVDGNS